MSQADSKSIILTITETQADRLFGRGVSKVSTDTPEQSRDLRIASQALRTLLHEVDRVASVAGDVARQLRELRVSGAG